jgi:radical SAM protein with 4Fe4S-binding SPASM domain
MNVNHIHKYELKIPLLVQLGLTYKCNLKCSHCYALYKRENPELSSPEVKDLLRKLYDIGSCRIVYSHGENLIRKDFFDIAFFAYSLSYYQTLMTNGFYIYNRSIAKKIKDAGVKKVLVSIDSADPKKHDERRGCKGAYENALNAVEYLMQENIPTVGFSTTIDRWNYDQLDEIVALAKKLGVASLSFMQNRYNLPSKFEDNNSMQYEKICEKLFKLIIYNIGVIDIYTHDPFMLNFLTGDFEKKIAEKIICDNSCHVGLSKVSIDPVGNVTGCNFIAESIGNIRNDCIARIWEKLVNKYNTALDKPCTSCAYLNVCSGGCKAFYYNGNFDQRCSVRRFNDKKSHNLDVITSVDNTLLTKNGNLQLIEKPIPGKYSFTKVNQ